jgi:hypothetical protein
MMHKQLLLNTLLTRLHLVSLLQIIVTFRVRHVLIYLPIVRVVCSTNLRSLLKGLPVLVNVLQTELSLTMNVCLVIRPALPVIWSILTCAPRVVKLIMNICKMVSALELVLQAHLEVRSRTNAKLVRHHVQLVPSQQFIALLASQLELKQNSITMVASLNAQQVWLLT